MNWEAIGAVGEIAGAWRSSPLLFISPSRFGRTPVRYVAVPNERRYRYNKAPFSQLQLALNLRMFTVERSFNLVRCLPRNRSSSIAQ